jgi:membrane-associated protein
MLDSILSFFSRLHDLRGLIQWGGYAVLALIIFSETGIFAGFFLPGDSIIVTAGLFAARGDLNILYLFFLLSLMAVLGDAVGYWFGRMTGPKIFTREDSLFFSKKHIFRAQQLYEKYGGKIIIIARFMPIVRTFAPIVAGIANMPYRKFFSYNIVGGVAWIASMLAIGYFLGRVIPGIDKRIDVVIIVVVFLSILPGIIEYLKHRSQRSRQAAATVAEE